MADGAKSTVNVRKIVDQFQDNAMTNNGVEMRGFRPLTTPTEGLDSPQGSNGISSPRPVNGSAASQSNGKSNNNSYHPPVSPKPTYPKASSPVTPTKPGRMTISGPLPISTSPPVAAVHQQNNHNHRSESQSLIQQPQSPVYAQPIRRISNRHNEQTRPSRSPSHRSRSPFYKRCLRKWTCSTWALGILAVICLIQLIIIIWFLLSSKQTDDGGETSITALGRGFAKPGQIIFQDDFDNFNLTKWRHERYITEDGFVIFGTDEKNSFVQDGMLYIQPTFTANDFNNTFMSYGTLVIGRDVEKSCSSFYRARCEKVAQDGAIINPIKSAILKTSEFFNFQYGTIQFRAKLPRGDWITTEIALRPKFEFYGEPADSARIVVVTSRGNANYEANNGTQFGQEMVCSQLVYSDSYSSALSSMVQYCHNSPPGQGFGDDFHDYKFEWMPDYMRLFIDDNIAGKFIANSFVPDSYKHVVISGEGNERKSSFNQQFYIELKVTVGTGFPENGFRSQPFRKPWYNNRKDAPRNFWSARQQWEPSWVNASALVIDYITVKALDRAYA